MTKRTCIMPECERPHLAKGLCSTHYNRTQPARLRHPVFQVNCTVCGALIERQHRADRRPTCSPDCRTILEFGEPSPSATSWATSALSRAQKYGVEREIIDRQSVLDRDGGMCYLCDVVLSDDVFSPDGATIDHVIPLSQGGPHTMDNVRACCLRCNSSKADHVA